MIDPFCLVMAIVIALICAYFFRQGLINSMNNVRVAQEAHEYLKRDSINITTIVDTYLYTNISVIPKNHGDDKDADNSADDTTDDSSDDAKNDSADFDNDSDSSDSGDSDGGGDD